MDNHVTSAESFLPYLEDKYNLVHIETDDLSQIYMRGSILCKEEAEQFIKDFSKCTKTEWNVAYEIKTPTKCAFHKLWCCQFSYRHKASYKKKPETNYKNLNCLANINIFVKKVTINTKRTDEYLRRYPPLAAIIKIKQEHSHAIDSTDVLRMRRPTEETKAKFEQYFEMGLSIPECRYLHVSLLTEEGIKDLEDAAINPTAEQVAYLYKLWRTQKDSKSLLPSEKTQQKITNSNSRQVSTIKDVDYPNLSDSVTSFNHGDNVNDTISNKRSYQDSEDGDLKRIKVLNNVFSDDAEDSDCSTEEKDYEICSYQELHKKFDLMDEESLGQGQNKQTVDFKDREYEDSEDEKNNSKAVDPFVTYFMFGPSKKSTTVECDVPHSKAVESAKLLLKYMENQSDTDLADIITVRRYLRKIKNKIDNPESVT